MKNEYILTPKHDYSIFMALFNVVKLFSTEQLLKVVLNYCNVQYMNDVLLSEYLTNYEIKQKSILHICYIGTVIIFGIITAVALYIHNQQALEAISVIVFAYTSLQSLFIIPQLSIIIEIKDIFKVMILVVCMIALQMIKYFYLNLYYHSKNIIKVKPKLMCIIDIALDLSLALSNENKTIQTDIYIAVVVILSIFVILVFNNLIYGRQFIQSILIFQTMYYTIILVVSIFSIWNGIQQNTYYALVYLFLIIGSSSYFSGIYFFQRKHIINVTRNMHYLIQLNHSIKELTQTEKISMNSDISLSTNDTLSLNDIDADKQTYQQQYNEMEDKLRKTTGNKYSNVYYDLMSSYLIKNNIPVTAVRQFQMIKLPIENPPRDITLINQVYSVEQIEILLKSTKIQPNHILSAIMYLCHLENIKSLHDQYYLAQQLGIKTLLQFDVGRMNQYEIQQFKKFLTRQLQYFILQLIEILYYIDPAKNYMTYAVTMFRYFIKEPELVLLSQNITNFDAIPQIDADKANLNYQFDQKAEKNFKLNYYDYSGSNQQIQSLTLVSMNQLNQSIKYMQFLKQFIEGVIQPNMAKYEHLQKRTPGQENQLNILQRCINNYSTIETMLEPLIINRQLDNHEPYLELIQLIMGNTTSIIALLQNYNDYLEVFCGIIDVKKLYDVIENRFHDISNYLVLYDYKVQSFLTPQKQHTINEYMDITKSCLKNVVEKLEIKIQIQNNEQLQKYNNYYMVMKQMMDTCNKFDKVFQDIYLEQQKFQNIQYACTQNTNQNTTLYISLLQQLLETSLQLVEHLIQLVEIFTRCDINLQKYNQVFTRFYLQDISFNIFSKYNTIVTNNNQQILPANNIEYTYHLEKFAKIQQQGQKYMFKLADSLFKFQYATYYALQQNMIKQRRSQQISIVQMRRTLNGMIQSYFKLYKSDPSTENLNKLRNIIKLVYISPNQDKELIYQKGSILQYNKNDYTDFNDVTNLFNVYNIIYGLKPEQIQVIINHWDLIPERYFLKNSTVEEHEIDNSHSQAFITLLQSNRSKLDISTEKNSQHEDISSLQEYTSEYIIPVDKTTHQYFQITESDTIGQYHIIPHNHYVNIPDTGKVKLQVNRRNKFDPKSQFYLYKIREQLYPSNKLYKLLDGPAALYDFKDINNLQHFKHLNININSEIQALLQQQNTMNQQICKFISVLLLTLLIVGNFALYYLQARLNIRTSAINMLSNTFVLENIDLTHHILYRQKYINKNDTLPYNQFSGAKLSNTYCYNKNIQQYQTAYHNVEKLIQQQLILSSQHDSNIIQYLQHVEYKSISFFSYLFNVIKSYEFPDINAELINRTQIINGSKYDKLSSVNQDFNFIIQKLQYIIQPDIYYSSQIGLYNQYTGSQIIKLLVIAFYQSVLFKYNVGPQSAQFITYNRTQFLNSELYNYKLNQMEVQILQGEKQYDIFYVGELYKKQYTQFYYLDRGKMDAYFSSIFNETQYDTNSEQRILYQINMSYASLVIVLVTSIFILLAIIAFVGGNVAMFSRNINQVLEQTEKEFNKNYLEYIGKDVLKNQIYLQTNIREKYIMYINNLIQHKVSIVSFKGSFIKYFKIEKKQKYYQPVLSKYCTNIKESVITQKYKFLQQFFFILIMIWFGQNVLQSVSMQIAITNKVPQFTRDQQEYIKSVTSLSAQLIKYQLFGRQHDVDGIVYQLLQLVDNSQYYTYPDFLYNVQYLVSYGYQTQCNISYNQTFTKMYETLKNQQQNLPVPDDDELTQQYCARLARIQAAVARFNQTLLQQVISDLDTQIIKRQNVFKKLHPDQDFETYYNSLTDFNQILFYHLLSNKNINMIADLIDIIDQKSSDITQYFAHCNINQALAYNRIIDTLTNQVIYVVVLITIYLTRYYKIKKMEFNKKNFLHNLMVIGISSVLVCVQGVCVIQIIYTKKCKPIYFNTSCSELLYMLQQFLKKVNMYNFNNYNPLDKTYYENIQSNFITNTYNGSFSLDQILNTAGSKILGTIALTHKDFYNFSLYNKITPQNLITGYYNEDKTFMEYITILGQLVVSTQQDLVENLDGIQKQLNTSSQQYVFFYIYQLIYFGIGMFFFYVLFYGIKPEANRAQQINIIVKPYIILYLAQINSQNFRLLYDQKYYKINKRMYQGEFFDNIQNKLDQLVNKYKDGLIAGKELIINRPNYVACCVYDEQQQCYYMVPAEDQLAAPDNLCTKCVEQMLIKRVNKKSTQKKVNITSQVYIQYLIIILLLIGYFTYVTTIIAVKFTTQRNASQQLESLNSHLSKLADIIYAYNILKIDCRISLDQYFRHYRLYMMFQKYENFWVTNDILLNNSVSQFPRLYRLLNIMKVNVFQCKMYDTSQLVDAIHQFVQGNVPNNEMYVYSLNIYVYLVLILIIGIILKLTLWCTFKEMHFIDTLFGFCTKGRTSLHNHIVR